MIFDKIKTEIGRVYDFKDEIINWNTIKKKKTFGTTWGQNPGCLGPIQQHYATESLIFGLWSSTSRSPWIGFKTLHNLHLKKRLYQKKKLRNPCFCFFALTSRNQLERFWENILEKNDWEKDTKQQQKCVSFETEDFIKDLEYTMMNNHFYQIL